MILTYSLVLKNITLEPVMVFLSFVTSMDVVSLGQLLVDKSCQHDFNFTQEVCDDLHNENFTHEKSQIENEVAQYKVRFVNTHNKK